MKADILQSRNGIKICFRKEPNDIGRDCRSNKLKNSWNQASTLIHGLRIAVKRQPSTKIPGVTRSMVREHIPRAIEEGILNHNPETISDWLLTEWHLARKLKLSPMRLAYFVSEAAAVPNGHPARLHPP